jgi:WD40 repeat protein
MGGQEADARGRMSLRSPVVSQFLCARHDAATSQAVSVDTTGNRVAVGGAKGLCVFDLDWPWAPERWLPSLGCVSAVEWHAGDARLLASADQQGALALYDLSTGHGPAGQHSSLVARRRLSVEVDAICWSSGLNNLLAARTVDGAVVLWDVRASGSSTWLWDLCSSSPGAVGDPRWQMLQATAMAAAAAAAATPVEQYAGRRHRASTSSSPLRAVRSVSGTFDRL